MQANKFFRFRAETDIFFFVTAVFRPVLGPIQPIIQWVPGAKHPELEADHRFLVPRLIIYGAIPPFPRAVIAQPV
jgi:hypothetical protein